MKQTIRKLDTPGSSEGSKPLRLVVAALMLRPVPDSDTHAVEVLICQRRPNEPMSLKWEFPGGKIEPGETAEEALARELNEELGIDAVIGRRIAQVHHKYRNGGAIDLQFFLVDKFEGTLENRIFNEIRWSPLAALPQYDFLAADVGFVRDLADGRLL